MSSLKLNCKSFDSLNKSNVASWQVQTSDINHICWDKLFCVPKVDLFWIHTQDFFSVFYLGEGIRILNYDCKLKKIYEKGKTEKCEMRNQTETEALPKAEKKQMRFFNVFFFYSFDLSWVLCFPYSTVMNAHFLSEILLMPWDLNANVNLFQVEVKRESKW